MTQKKNSEKKDQFGGIEELTLDDFLANEKSAHEKDDSIEVYALIAPKAEPATPGFPSA